MTKRSKNKTTSGAGVTTYRYCKRCKQNRLFMYNRKQKHSRCDFCQGWMATKPK